jgi:hypothetical protein
VVERIKAGRKLLDERDDLIRQHIAAGVPRKALMEATGLSRPQLDTIRRGERDRSAL